MERRMEIYFQSSIKAKVTRTISKVQ
jgi:hypothetical protein